MGNFIKNREPVAVAAFVLALVQGGYVVANEFGRALTVGQWSAITSLLTLVAGFLVRGNVASNATMAAKATGRPTTPPVSISIVLFVATVAGLLLGCTPENAKTAEAFADDAVEVVRIICLADHAKSTGKSAREMGGLCRTPEQLAPYEGRARGTCQ